MIVDFDLVLTKLLDMPVGEDIVGITSIGRQIFLATQQAIYLVMLTHLEEEME